MNAPVRTFGKYLLDEEIARGGMSRVHLARLRGLGGFEKRLVVKQILPELARDPRFVSMFVHEAKTLVQMSHPHIAPVYELGVVDGVYFLAMEYVEGATLAEILRDGPLAPGLAAHLGAEIGDALHYAHARFEIVHRDVTPKNVIVDAGGHSRLLDFGIAAPAEDEAGTELFGTPGYLSPEHLGGALGPRSDVFSLGAVLFEALTGRRAFPGKTVDDTRAALAAEGPDFAAEDAVPEGLAAVVRRALARDLAARWGSARELARALRAWLASHAPEGVGPELGQRAERAELERDRLSAVPDEEDEGALGSTPSEVKTLATSRLLEGMLDVEGPPSEPDPGTVKIAGRRGAASDGDPEAPDATRDAADEPSTAAIRGRRETASGGDPEAPDATRDAADEPSTAAIRGRRETASGGDPEAPDATEEPGAAPLPGRRDPPSGEGRPDRGAGGEPSSAALRGQRAGGDATSERRRTPRPDDPTGAARDGRRTGREAAEGGRRDRGAGGEPAPAAGEGRAARRGGRPVDEPPEGAPNAAEGAEEPLEPGPGRRGVARAAAGAGGPAGAEPVAAGEGRARWALVLVALALGAAVTWALRPGPSGEGPRPTAASPPRDAPARDGSGADRNDSTPTADGAEVLARDGTGAGRNDSTPTADGAEVLVRDGTGAGRAPASTEGGADALARGGAGAARGEPASTAGSAAALARGGAGGDRSGAASPGGPAAEGAGAAASPADRRERRTDGERGPDRTARPRGASGRAAEERSAGDARATLTVNATPWAEVRLDGRPLGRTPQRRVSVRPGRHTLELECPPLGRTARRTFEAAPGDALHAFVDLNAEAPTLQIR